LGRRQELDRLPVGRGLAPRELLGERRLPLLELVERAPPDRELLLLLGRPPLELARMRLGLRRPAHARPDGLSRRVELAVPRLGGTLALGERRLAPPLRLRRVRELAHPLAELLRLGREIRRGGLVPLAELLHRPLLRGDPLAPGRELAH